MPQSVTNQSGSIVRGNWTGRTSLYGTRTRTGDASVLGFAQGIALSSATSFNGDSSNGRHLQTGVTQSISDGFPSTPSLQLDWAGFWRFRWVTKPGQRAIYVWANQNSTGSYRPTVVVKSNPVVGLNADISASAPEGPGWQQVGPITFTATNAGMVWVELHNNNVFLTSSVLFDHIITT